MAIVNFDADGKQISRTITTSYIFGSGGSLDGKEVSEETVLEVYAVSQADVDDTIDANQQPAGVLNTHSYDSQLVNRETDVYNMTRTLTEKTIIT